MHVRSLSIREKWLRIENTIPFVRDVVQPTVESIDGNLGLCMLVDQRKPQAIAMSAWVSEQAMHASDAAIAPVRSEAEQRLGGDANLEEWELVALRRNRPIYPGCWASVARLQVAGGSLDSLVESYRRTSLADTVALPGARAALLLVHAGDNRAVSAVVFDNYAVLNAAARRPPGLHALRAAGAEVDVAEVGEYEVEIAGSRLPESV